MIIDWSEVNERLHWVGIRAVKDNLEAEKYLIGLFGGRKSALLLGKKDWWVKRKRLVYGVTI